VLIYIDDAANIVRKKVRKLLGSTVYNHVSKSYIHFFLKIIKFVTTISSFFARH